jgi:hypothetical protein
MAKGYPTRSAAEIARLREAYCDSAEPVAAIVKRFGLRGNELYALIEQLKWPQRGQSSAAKLIANPAAKPKPKTQKQIVEERRAEEEARERALWVIGRIDARAAVLTLRRRGFIVNREKGGKALVGNKLLSLEEVIATAAREGALAGMAAPVKQVAETASGLRVGQTVALQPKKRPVPVAVKRKEGPPLRQGSGRAAKAPSPASAPQPKTRAEHSADLGTRPRVVWLDLGLLAVDKRYQREIGQAGQKHINRIVRSFNWNCYQPVIVTERADGRYAVIDGQHRLEAAKKHPLVDSLPCYVIDAPDLAKQAAVFVAVNSVRKSLTSNEKFAAAVAAGDKHAVALARICDEAGVTILRGPPGRAIGPMELLSPLVPQRLVGKLGAGAVRDAVTLIAETHRRTPGAFRSALITALARIAADKACIRDGIRDLLSRTDLARLHGEALVEAKGGNNETITAATERLLRRRLGMDAGRSLVSGAVP